MMYFSLSLSLSLQSYVVPQGALFGDVMGNPNILFNNIRIYGTILLLLLSIIVFVGVKLVSLSLSLFLSLFHSHSLSVNDCLHYSVSLSFVIVIFAIL